MASRGTAHPHRHSVAGVPHAPVAAVHHRIQTHPAELRKRCPLKPRGLDGFFHDDCRAIEVVPLHACAYVDGAADVVAALLAAYPEGAGVQSAGGS
eukprot:4511538-Prymnesium_polylepis.1